MALASSCATTIDDKNNDIIWNATFDTEDAKRFCSLNLTITMEVSDDLSDLVCPLLVFKATKFVRVEEWKQKDESGTYERHLWDKRVNVSFQSYAWVDSETNLYGLSKAKSIPDRFEQSV